MVRFVFNQERATHGNSLFFVQFFENKFFQIDEIHHIVFTYRYVF